MKRAIITFVLVLVSASAAASQARDVIVTGRVTNEEGSPVARATVYVMDFTQVRAETDSAGNYRLVVPAGRLAGIPEDSYLRLRVRALGFIPGNHMLSVAAGPQLVNFKLTSPNEPRDEVRVPPRKPMTGERTRPPEERQPAASTGQLPDTDPFGLHFFTPEQVMQYQTTIRLTQSQRETLQAAILGSQEQVVRMQWSLAQESEKMSQLLAGTSLNETAIMTQLDRIIAVERELKRAQMSLLIKIRNTLTREQQEGLRILRSRE